MRSVAPHLRLAGSVIISNIWLLEDGAGRRFLVDTGHPLERLALRWSLYRAGVRGPGDLTAVLLTHRHSDHAGNAAWLRRTFDCPVVCHQADAPILEGKAPRPALARGIGLPHDWLLCHIEDRFPAVSPVDEALGPGAWRWGFRVLEVPGHTEGSVMLHHEPTGTLFSGDAILAGIPPLRFFESFSLAVPAYSLDTEACHAAVRAWLRDLPRTEALCAGHGPAVTRGTHQKLMRLVLR